MIWHVRVFFHTTTYMEYGTRPYFKWNPTHMHRLSCSDFLNISLWHWSWFFPFKVNERDRLLWNMALGAQHIIIFNRNKKLLHASRYKASTDIYLNICSCVHHHQARGILVLYFNPDYFPYSNLRPLYEPMFSRYYF